MRRMVLAVSAAVCLLAGCTHPIFDNEYPTVNEFDVNRADIVYVDKKLGNPVRVQITGAGVVDVETGSSPLLTDSFSIDTSHVQWNDIQRGHQTISREDARMIFQALVNHGLCRKEPPELEKPPAGLPADFKPERQARVVANFNGRIIKREVVFDELLLGHIEYVTKVFLRQSKGKR